MFFEYIMLEGVNDSDEDADRLAEISRLTVQNQSHLLQHASRIRVQVQRSGENQGVQAARQRRRRDVHDSTITRRRGSVRVRTTRNPGDAGCGSRPPRARETRARARDARDAFVSTIAHRA